MTDDLRERTDRVEGGAGPVVAATVRVGGRWYRCRIAARQSAPPVVTLGHRDAPGADGTPDYDAAPDRDGAHAAESAGADGAATTATDGDGDADGDGASAGPGGDVSGAEAPGVGFGAGWEVVGHPPDGDGDGPPGGLPVWRGLLAAHRAALSEWHLATRDGGGGTAGSGGGGGAGAAGGRADARDTDFEWVGEDVPIEEVDDGDAGGGHSDAGGGAGG